MLRYAVIGTGAVGGLYGAKLHAAGAEVHFLARSDFEDIARGGLRVESIWGDLALPRVHVWNDPRRLPPCEVFLVCVKTTANAGLPALLRPALRVGALVVLMQNGLGNEEALAAALPGAALAGGLCFLCCNKAGPGHIRHLDYGRIEFGAHDASAADRLGQVVSDFSQAGVPCEATAPLAAARWRKLAWNIPFNGLSVVLRAQTDGIMARPSGRALVEALMGEVRLGAEACGHGFPPEHIRRLLESTEKMKPYKTSMMLDFEAGRPLEIEYLYERPIAAARAHGVEMPRTAEIAGILRFLDGSRGGVAAPGGNGCDPAALKPAVSPSQS